MTLIQRKIKFIMVIEDPSIPVIMTEHLKIMAVMLEIPLILIQAKPRELGLIFDKKEVLAAAFMVIIFYFSFFF